MKIYVFGTNKESTVVKPKDALFIGNETDLDLALEKFQNCIDAIKYFNCYLIVDFEIGTGRKIFKVSKYDSNSDTLPFFTVCEWHLKMDRDMKTYIRKDHTNIHSNGYCYEFSNNLKALQFFLYCIEKEPANAEFNIVYLKNESILDNTMQLTYKDTAKIIRKIADSSDVKSIRKRRMRAKPILKFKISSIDWDFYPLTQRTFYNCPISDKAKASELLNSATVVNE